MKNKAIIIFVLSFVTIFISDCYADKIRYDMNNGTNNGQNGRIKAEGCARARAYNEMNISNVRCRINTGGDMWWDLSGSPIYEIPKDSKKHSMFAAALWIGGKDATGKVKVAAQMYRQTGVDFWPGPLTTDLIATIDEAVCKEYDRHWILYRQDVYALKSWQDNKEANPDYVMPESIEKYPAHGDVNLRQPRYLAPFYDADGDYNYDPSAKDYPYYDLNGEFEEPGNSRPTMEGNGIMADQILKGDMTLWWVFNDKGNTHSETGGDAIGLEFRAQAFAFATSDEVNDMTFYSYEIINRGTNRLDSTYFCQWTDADLGYAYDDYVGCDVQRGLAYCYNGNTIDGSGASDHYGENPPAIGIDFFQGPYLDPDTIDNFWDFDPLKPDFVPADIEDEAWNSINGINFGDGFIDNERFGMKSFVYFDNNSTDQGNPDVYQDYYNYLRGIWKNNENMVYGGKGVAGNAGATNVTAKFMFPGDTDPWLWGTRRVNPNYNSGTNVWTEEVVAAVSSNPPYDRRLMQSAGPFTLEPGAVNYITVGIPWARASSGGPFASVEKLRVVDDKCQLLFINNFRMVDGPDAPIIEVQEMDKEVILYLTYPIEYNSNNIGAKYQEGDYKIITPFGVSPKWDSIYRFEGYQIFQLRNSLVTVGDIYDPDKARLVAQCDVKNKVSKITNYNYKSDLGGEVPQIMVNGENKGLRHSFRITEDKFASGSDKRLVNNKAYYFIAVAYAHNEYKKYLPNVSSNIDGQKFPYLQGRFNAKKAAIEPKKVIPHNPLVENGGTVINALYGTQPKMSLIEGQGNGGNIIDLEESTINTIMAGPPWRAQGLSYKKGYGPLNIKIVDPLSVKNGEFILKFVKITDAVAKKYVTLDSTNTPIDSADWVLINVNTGAVELSDRNLTIQYEQLFFNYGFSITLQQMPLLAPTTNIGANLNKLNNVIDNAFLTSSITFSGSTQWIQGIADNDKIELYDWIRSGMDNLDYRNLSDQGRKSNYWDGNSQFEKVVDKSWAPFGLTRYVTNSGQSSHYPCAIKETDVTNAVKLAYISSIDVVLTSDKSKWTRTPVIEMCHNRAFADKGLTEWGNNHPANKTSSAYYYPKQFGLRWGQSVDKDGNAYPNADTISSSDPNAPNYIASTSMGWFPGYVINVETGERLNIAFSENSRFPNHNGKDMMYNPSTTLMEAKSGYTTDDNTDTIFGGMHYLYVFGHFADGKACPAYDYGRWLHDTLRYAVGGDNDIIRRNIYKYCTWVGLMYAVKNTTWLESEAKIRIRVTKPYDRYYSTSSNKLGANAQNADYPMFSISLSGVETEFNNQQVANDALDLIRVVPNPYYSWSEYEETQTDNRVRITNLPVKCTISIYNSSGTLIRRFTRDDKEVTFQDWDLKNHAGIPISGGVYIIHIDAPGIGEKVVKWFGGLRPVDLNSF